MAFLPKQYSSFRVKSKWQEAADLTTSKCNMEATRFTTASGLEDMGDQDLKKSNNDEKSFVAVPNKDNSFSGKFQSTGSIPEFRSKFIGTLNLPSFKRKVPIKPIRAEQKVALISDTNAPSFLTNVVSLRNVSNEQQKERTSERFLLGKIVISPVQPRSESIDVANISQVENRIRAQRKGSQRHLLSLMHKSNKNPHHFHHRFKDESPQAIFSKAQLEFEPMKHANKINTTVPSELPSLPTVQNPLINETLDEAMCLESEVSGLCESTPRPSFSSQSVAQEDLHTSKCTQLPRDKDLFHSGGSIVRLPQERTFKNLLSIPTNR